MHLSDPAAVAVLRLPIYCFPLPCAGYINRAMAHACIVLHPVEILEVPCGKGLIIVLCCGSPAGSHSTHVRGVPADLGSILWGYSMALLTLPG